MIRTMVLVLTWCIALFAPHGADADIRHLYAAAGMSPMPQGEPAPAFHLAAIDSTSVDSAQLRGKVLLVNFWATWCGPCKEEMPALDRLKALFAGKDFELLAVTTDHQLDAIQKFVAALGLRFPILIDETKDVSAMFGVRGLPTTVVIDKHGRLSGRAVGPRRWDGPEPVALIQALMDGAQ
jgi:peroxiredoxin